MFLHLKIRVGTTCSYIIFFHTKKLYFLKFSWIWQLQDSWQLKHFYWSPNITTGGDTLGRSRQWWVFSHLYTCWCALLGHFLFPSAKQDATEFLTAEGQTRETGRGKRNQEEKEGVKCACITVTSLMPLPPPLPATLPLSSQLSTLYGATPSTPETTILTTSTLE